MFSNILEKIMISQMYTFIESKNLLVYSQFGFRNGLSITQDAVLFSSAFIAECFEGNTFCVVSFTDLSKTFVVSHKMLPSYDLDENAT